MSCLSTVDYKEEGGGKTAPQSVLQPVQKSQADHGLTWILPIIIIIGFG